ncbi:MAG: ketoacyl-ACP synthase III [Burkholderiales bacterium]|nr:ketoacyl-ACP synthase III [Burkholderiales bacterium]
MENKIYSRIVSTGRKLPKNCVTNTQLAERLAKEGIETSDEWIRTRTGIESRYFASGDETTTSLGAEAARQALTRGSYDPKDVDLIIVATTTPDGVFPSVACRIQAVLGCTNAGAFDIQAVCSGFVYGLSIADGLIRAGQLNTILVVGSETFSGLLDWSDRGTCVLFGDGAGAVLLTRAQQPGILDWELKADGTKGESILAVTGHIRNGKVYGDPYIRMDGKGVFKAAIESMTSSAKSVLSKAGVSPKDLSLFIPHQANLRIMKVVAEKLGVSPDVMMVSVDSHGNTSAASVPLALDKAVEDGRIKRGDLVLLQGVGGGFTWGSVLLKY